jgi:hypothetical protein
VRSGRLAAPAAALLLAGASLGLGACGDDEATTPTTTTESTAETTAPDLTVDPATTTTSTTSTPTTTESTPTTPPALDDGRPDSEKNDLPPKPGTPEAAFEAECEANPEACG